MHARKSASNAARSARRLLTGAVATGLLGVSQLAYAQDVNPSGSDPIDDEELIVLSPFVVDAQEDAGSYRATSTLAGSRIRTDLKDVASSISVITAEFLKDTGATDNQTLLQYTTNTEVGGIYGNYTGVGGTFIDGASEGNNFLRPNNNTRVRGLDSADNTRDLFQTDIPWDAFNVGRVDLQRGPNSILFGFGSPAGIINTSLNGATLGRSEGSAEFRVGSFGSMRASFDYNKVLLEDELAIRVSAVADNTQYRQDPAFNDSTRIFGAVRWAPKFLQTDSASTVIRANYESGEVTANRPRVLPPWDHITPYFDSSAINKGSWDPYMAWAQGVVVTSSDGAAPGVTPNPWVVQYFGPGVQNVSAPTFVYDTSDANNYVTAYQASPGTYWGINTAGERDGGIDGYPYGSNIGIGSYSEMARLTNLYIDSSLFPAADKGFYKRKSLTDPTIFDFYNKLMDGDAKREWQNWDAYNITLEQTLFDGKVGIELVYDKQEYDDGQSRNLNDPYISVDIRSNLARYPGVYSDLAVANPNVGRAFVAGNSKNGGNSLMFSERENFRATAFADIRFDDFMADDSFIARMLGRHVITGVYSEETYDREDRNFVRYAVDSSWSDAIGTGSTGANDGGLSQGDVTIDWVYYLSGNLSAQSSASGLDLPRITGQHNPSGEHAILYFNSRWNSDSVDPSAYWFNPARGQTNDPVGEESTESENPANYVGWEYGSFQVLNAMEGDIDQLYTDISRIRRQTESTALTWQAYLIDDLLVGTWGWREDTQKLRSGADSSNAAGNDDGYAHVNPDLDPLDEETGVSEGESTSWGLVLHTPRSIRERMPWGTNISLTYSSGSNSRVENRYGFDGNVLPNAEGETEDYGVVISTLDDRLQLKVTKYETTVTNANLSSVSSEVSTLGSNTYYLRNLEGWGTGTVMAYLNGMDGGSPGNEWFWNWALIDENWDGAYNDPTSDAFLNHPSTIAQKAAIQSWLSQMMPASWYEAYGFNINYAAAVSGDYANSFPGWDPGPAIGNIQPAGGGRINGSWPTGTVNNKSEGWEFEIIGQPTKNLNVSINASKTTASQTALGDNLVAFIESQYAKFQSPAGDLRLWWAGGGTMRETYEQNIWSAYQFQLQTNGKLVPEMAPWRANVIANYNFDEGMFKGTNVGIAYRWQDGRILGYALNADGDNLDVDNPYWSSSEDHLDLWIGHERKLTEKLRWRIQLNFRNLGESPHLEPISVQPDGSAGAFRIAEGTTWTLTNTFTF